MKTKYNSLIIALLVLAAFVSSCKKAKIFADDDRPIITLESPLLDTMINKVGDTILIKGNMTDYAMASASIKLFKIYGSQVLLNKILEVGGKTLFTFNEQYILQPNDTGWIQTEVNAKDENENIALEQRKIWVMQ